MCLNTAVPHIRPSFPLDSQSSTSCLIVGFCICSHQLLDEVSSLFDEYSTRIWSQNTLQAGHTVGSRFCDWVGFLIPLLEALTGYRRRSVHALCPLLLWVFTRILSLILWSFHCTSFPLCPHKCPPIQFYWSTCVLLCQYHAVFITTALKYRMESGIVILLEVLLF